MMALLPLLTGSLGKYLAIIAVLGGVCGYVFFEHSEVLSLKSANHELSAKSAALTAQVAALEQREKALQAATAKAASTMARNAQTARIATEAARKPLPQNGAAAKANADLSGVIKSLELMQ